MSSTLNNSSLVIATSKQTKTKIDPVVADLNYTQTILYAAAIGIIGGLVATTYYYLLENLTHIVWHTFPEMLQFSGDF